MGLYKEAEKYLSLAFELYNWMHELDITRFSKTFLALCQLFLRTNKLTQMKNILVIACSYSVK